MRGLNLNKIPNLGVEPIENYAICNIKTGKVASFIYSFCNVNLEKCRELVYTIDIKALPKSVRWGAILIEESINKISQIIGDDLLSMEEKKEFLNTIKEVNDDNRILQDWMIEENDRWRHEDEISTATRKGLEQGLESGREEVILKMLSKKVSYDFISEVTGKSINEIKEIEKSSMK